MIKKALIFAVTAASLASGASAFAQSDYRTDGHERYQHYDRDSRSVQSRSHDRNDRYDRYDRNDRYPGGASDYRNHRSERYSRTERGYRDGYVQQRDHRYYQAPQVVQYGYNNNQYYGGVQQHWRRGMVLSNHYRGNRYVVNDWDRHQRLYAPQRGHHWVQNGNDFLMVAIASGLIAHVLLGN